MKRAFKFIVSFLSLVVLVFNSGCAPKKEEILSFEENASLSNYDDSVGYLLVYDSTGKVVSKYCSGFVVDKGSKYTYVVSSYDYVKDNAIYRFVINEKKIDCNYIGGDSHFNIAVFSFRNSEYNAIPLSFINDSDYIKRGNSVYVSMITSYSISRVNNLTISKGIISSNNAVYCSSNYLANCEDYFLIDNVSFKSALGAPLFDYYGRVIGVVSNVTYNSNNNIFSYASKGNDVKKVVSKIINGKEYLHADLHIEFKQYQDFSLEERENIIFDVKSSNVIIVNSTGYSASLNIPLYSKIVSVDSIQTQTLTELVSVIGEYQRDDMVTLKVQVGEDLYKSYTIKL